MIALPCSLAALHLKVPRGEGVREGVVGVREELVGAYEGQGGKMGKFLRVNYGGMGAQQDPRTWKGIVR